MLPKIPLHLTLLLLIAACASSPAADAAKVQELLREYDQTSDRERIRQIADDLPRFGAAAVQPISALLFRTNPTLLDGKAVPLIEAIAKIGSPEAVAVIRQELNHQALVPGEVLQAQAIARAFAPPEEEGQPAVRSTTVQRLWSLLTPAEQEWLTTYAGEEEPEEAMRRNRLRIVRILNRLQQQMDMVHPEDVQNLNLSTEVLGWIPELFPDSKAANAGLGTYHMERFNRLVIEAAFPGAISPHDGFSKGAHSFSRRQAALSALAVMQDPLAGDLLLSLNPTAEAPQVQLLRAVGDLASREAVDVLVEYVAADSKNVSNVATKSLLQQIEQGRVPSDLALSGAVRQALSRENADLPLHVLENSLVLLERTGSQRVAAQMVAEILQSGKSRAIEIALERLVNNAALLNDPAPVDPLIEQLLPQTPWQARTRLAAEMLEKIRQIRPESALPVASALLDHPDHGVRMRACDAMGALTRQSFGRNTSRWKAWVLEQR